MPIAAARNDVEGERFDLQSAPPDGYVVLKRLSYGQKMFRRGLLSKAKMETGSTGNNRAERRANVNKGVVAELELMNEKVTLFEFANCIVDHNLEFLANPQDASSVQRLDFKNPEHVKMLDGRVGEEIDELITDLNNFEVDDEVGKQ
jgi:hypothetical protein